MSKYTQSDLRKAEKFLGMPPGSSRDWLTVRRTAEAIYQERQEVINLLKNHTMSYIPPSEWASFKRHRDIFIDSIVALGKPKLRVKEKT